jgi:hypothetical protein
VAAVSFKELGLQLVDLRTATCHGIDHAGIVHALHIHKTLGYVSKASFFNSTLRLP